MYGKVTYHQNHASPESPNEEGAFCIYCGKRVAGTICPHCNGLFIDYIEDNSDKPIKNRKLKIGDS